MKNMKSIHLVMVVFFVTMMVTLIACSPKLYLPEQAHSAWVAETYQYTGTVDQFNHARTMYTQYCQSCHDLHMPSEYTISEWDKIYTNMSAKVAIGDSSKRMILYYILAGAKDAEINQ